MKILISGFEPFGGRSSNPTKLIIEAIIEKKLSLPKNVIVESILLPVTFKESFDLLKKRTDSFHPDIILSLGQAGGRNAIELERVAINCLDADIPDNLGHQPRDEKIDPEGESAYFSTLPLRELEAALKAADLPCRISNSAGTYVCNYLFYQLLKSASENEICGFIHFPYLPEQAKDLEPFLPLDKQLQAVEIMLQTLSKTRPILP
jgi:pyroglutamyl-peptidase